jgi:translation elongation factor EF-G
MLSVVLSRPGLPHVNEARESYPVSDSQKCVRVGLVGINGSGVRTLIGALSGSLIPETSARRIWDGVDICLAAARPDVVLPEECDVLILVISARQGVPTVLADVWHAATQRGLPSLIAVTHIDDSLVDLEEVTAMCMRVLSDGGQIFLPWLPILGDDESVCGFINLLSEEIVDWSEGGPVIHASEQRHQDLIEESRAELCESIMLSVADDKLFSRYMEGEAIDGEHIEHEMLEQILRGLRHPVFGIGTRPHLLGVGLLLDTIAELDHLRTAQAQA